MSIGRFYAGIGALIASPQDEKYLLLRRSQEKDYAAGAWECVTGRVDQGEGFEDAVRREVFEEIGVSDIRLDFIIGTTHFYRGTEDPRNELIGVVYACSLEDPGAVRTSAEHVEYRWLNAADAYEMLMAVDPATQWLRRVIQRAEAIRASLPPQLRTLFQQEGFELG